MNETIARHLIAALAVFYDEFYDGPETRCPEWVGVALEAVGEHLEPGRTWPTQCDAAHAAIDKARAA